MYLWRKSVKSSRRRTARSVNSDMVRDGVHLFTFILPGSPLESDSLNLKDRVKSKNVTDLQVFYAELELSIVIG